MSAIVCASAYWHGNLMQSDYASDARGFMCRRTRCLHRLVTYRMPRRGVHLAQITNHLDSVAKFIHTNATRNQMSTLVPPCVKGQSLAALWVTCRFPYE